MIQEHCILEDMVFGFARRRECERHSRGYMKKQVYENLLVEYGGTGFQNKGGRDDKAAVKTAVFLKEWIQ